MVKCLCLVYKIAKKKKTCILWLLKKEVDIIKKIIIATCTIQVKLERKTGSNKIARETSIW